MNFNNVTFNDAAGTETGITALNVLGNLVVSGVSSTNLDGVPSGGTVNLSGNLSVISGPFEKYQPLYVNFIGGNAQTVSILTTNAAIFTINKSGGSVTLENNLTEDGYPDFTVQSGTLNLNGYILNIPETLNMEAGGTLNCDGGCGAGTACGQGAGDLVCGGIYNTGGVINP